MIAFYLRQKHHQLIKTLALLIRRQLEDLECVLKEFILLKKIVSVTFRVSFYKILQLRKVIR